LTLDFKALLGFVKWGKMSNFADKNIFEEYGKQ
jgi:hypothetical protein